MSDPHQPKCGPDPGAPPPNVRTNLRPAPPARLEVTIKHEDSETLRDLLRRARDLMPNAISCDGDTCPVCDLVSPGRCWQQEFHVLLKDIDAALKESNA